MAIHHGRIEPYHIDLHLATSMKSWRRLRKQLPELTVPKRPGGGGATIWTADRRQSVHVGHALVLIDVKGYRRRERFALERTCVHEAAHVAVFMHEHINTSVSGEPFAYLVDWLAGWLMERTR